MPLRSFRPLLIGFVLWGGNRVHADISELPARLLSGTEAPEPDWSGILEARIKAGEPLPELPPDKTGPPANSGPAELLAYWREYWPWRNKEQPSSLDREKILEAVQAEPAAIPEVLKALPPNEAAAKSVDALLGKLSNASFEDGEKLREVRAWIYRNSGLQREEVIADALGADWELYLWDERPDPTLDALQSREPEVADRLLREFTTGKNGGLSVVAARLLLERAKDDEAERWRKELIEAAANPVLPEEARQIATHALIDAKWPGRETWMLESLKSPGLGDPHWFLSPVHEDPDHWIPLLAALVGGPNKHAHDHAVHLLVTFADDDDPRIDAIRPLLPWLKDAKWAEERYSDRLLFIQSLDAVPLPECIEGLKVLMSADTDGGNLAYSSGVLLHYKVKSAVPAMKEALVRCDSEHDRRRIIGSVHGLGGFNVDEIVVGLESYLASLPSDRYDFSPELEELGKPETHIGEYFARALPADAALVEAIGKRADEIEREKAPLAAALRNAGATASNREGRAMLANCLARQSLDKDVLNTALDRCHEPSWEGSAFRSLLDRGGVVRGFAAVLSGDKEAMASALQSDDAGTQAALLAAAWQTGDPLDLNRVAGLLNSKDGTVSEAARAYLNASSDPEAKVLLGDGSSRWDPANRRYGDFDRLVSWVGKRYSIADGPLEIFSLTSSVQGGMAGEWHGLVYPDRMLAVRDFGDGRMGSCRLTDAQLAPLRRYVVTYRTDELPSLELPISDGIQYGYVHATAGLSRSVSISNPPTSREEVERYVKDFEVSKGIVIYTGLVRQFHDLFEGLALDYVYGAGAEILIPREKGKIRSVWKKGDDLRVLVENSTDAPQWRRVSLATKDLAGPVEEPAECPFLEARADLHPAFRVDDYHFRSPWRVRSGDSTVHAGKFGEVLGLWRCRRGKEPEPIAKGRFLSELVSDDGKWCVAIRAAESDTKPDVTVRINLDTKEVTPVDLEDAGKLIPVSFLAAHGKFVMSRWEDQQEMTFHLLDPATGAVEPATGEFHLLGEKSFRPLQSAGAPHLAWASDSAISSGGIYAKIGKYDHKALAFEMIKDIKGISFESDAMWIDEAEGMIYAALNGDLIRIPLR